MVKRKHKRSVPKTVDLMTVKELLAVPDRESWNSPVAPFTSLVLVPRRRIHDSGYRCITAIACRYLKPICKVTWSSDVINLDGIGGYGKWKVEDGIPRLIPPKGWSIDFLQKSGCANLFANGDLTVCLALSSFSVYARG